MNINMSTLVHIIIAVFHSCTYLQRNSVFVLLGGISHLLSAVYGMSSRKCVHIHIQEIPCIMLIISQLVLIVISCLIHVVILVFKNEILNISLQHSFFGLFF